MDSYFEEKEPDYIEESPDILLLKNHYPPESLSIQKGHWKAAFTLLIQTLFLTYGHTYFSELVNNSSNHEESIKFSKNMKIAIETNQWAKSTSCTAYTTLKKILAKTNINQGFINKINIPYEKKIKQNSPEFCLPTHYKKLPSEDPVKQILVGWILSIKKNTKYKSQMSIRAVVAYIIKFFHVLGIELQEFSQIKDLSFDDLKLGIENTNPSYSLKTKINYTIAFLCLILDDSTYLKQLEIFKKKVNPIKKPSDDHDQHRISKEELEKMYDASQFNIRDRCIFLLMISTGMRACGISNIQLRHVCTILNNNVTINNSGRTIEKGNKWFTFSICENLSLLLKEYINNHRVSRTSYLFPGRGENIGLSPSRINAVIKNIAKKAGLSGSHIHAHSLRHSFAHILVESGNKPELVSKMLGHVSVKTTEQYYLKESPVEVSKRMNIPWLGRQEQVDPVPNFLKINKDKLEEEEKKNKVKKTSKKERNKILKSLVKDFQNK